MPRIQYEDPEVEDIFKQAQVNNDDAERASGKRFSDDGNNIPGATKAANDRIAAYGKEMTHRRNRMLMGGN